VPNVFETALLQFMLLFSDNIPQHKIEKSVEISRASRIFRIIVSWSLLLVSKLIGISSPLYFQGLVENANDADYASKSLGTVHLVIQTSAIGLMIGYCGSKLLSAVVQLISEFVLFPATTSVAEILPNQAFSAALRNAYKRNGTSIQKKIAGNEAKSPSISASEKATAAYARRVLDRGLKAANQFLYRSIFNLLPAYVESICIVVLISYKTTQLLGVTAAVVAFSFVYITSAFMHYRVNIIRKQLAAEGTVNGFAEDSLALAETVASFGTMEIEEKRYADGLKNASKVEVEVRQSFSTLKLMQVLILGLGTTILMYCAWLPVSYKDPDSLSAGDSSDTSSIARNLMLSQSLFAQLCSVLSMVGQHFRDCVSGAEDMRELEEIVRTDALQRQSTESPPNQVPVEDRTKKSGGSAPILEVRNLHFGYPPNVYLQERSAKERKLSDASISPKKVILKNISFSIPSGGYSIGIVGPSGRFTITNSNCEVL
jgi:ABC-type multidrug transport system fused ATPase/permease subunit